MIAYDNTTPIKFSEIQEEIGKFDDSNFDSMSELFREENDVDGPLWEIDGPETQNSPNTLDIPLLSSNFNPENGT